MSGLTLVKAIFIINKKLYLPRKLTQNQISDGGGDKLRALKVDVIVVTCVMNPRKRFKILSSVTAENASISLVEVLIS